jgi:signal transduction histidine kinase
MLVGAGVFLIQDGADLEAGYHSVRQDFGFYVLFFLSWAAGLGIRALRDRAGALERLTAQLKTEREETARLAVFEERTRMARELHDVVAHGVTVMVLNSGAARQLVDNEPEKAKSTLVSVEAAGRQALAELRRMLGVLRGRSEDELRPPTGLRDLDELASQLEASGVNVDVVVEGQPRELEPGLDLSAYRIVQEALTNVLKHAEARRASVRIAYRDRELELEVIDDGIGGDTNGAGGHGLDGLRERAAIYGGTLSVGPRSSGGFRVEATLPIDLSRS